jgi:membrane protease YdiL (CAAX protease family)
MGFFNIALMMMDFRHYLYSRNKPRRIAELFVLFILLPFILTWSKLNIPLMLVLLFMGISVYIYLIHDPTFDRKTLLNWQQGKAELGKILIMFGISAIVMLVLIWIIDASKMFLLLRTNPWLLLIISIFYPLFSVIPQGLAYRSMFFHRYGDLFPGNAMKIISSAAVFAFGHILYKNWMVLVLTFVAGLIFGYRYYKTKSLAISILEHALYGVWLFTCGLGYFFVSSFVE